jgi:hypothetical protein
LSTSHSSVKVSELIKYPKIRINSGSSTKCFLTYVTPYYEDINSPY